MEDDKMSEEDNKANSSRPTLRDLLTMFIAGHQEQHRLEAGQDAVLREALNARLEGMNQIREAMRDLMTKTLTREVFDIAMETQNERWKQLWQWQNRVIGGVLAGGLLWTILVAAANIGIAIWITTRGG